MTAWRRTIDAFRGHLDRVATGWTRDELLQHAGEPDSRRGGRWVYAFAERAFGASRYAYAVVRLRAGRVAGVSSNLEPHAPV